jgi:hypothetical protein
MEIGCEDRSLEPQGALPASLSFRPGRRARHTSKRWSLTMEPEPRRLSATLGYLADPDRGILVHLGCRANVPVQMPDGFWTELHVMRRRYGRTVTAAEAVELWGPATTLEEIERRAACAICGARRPLVTVSLHVPTVWTSDLTPPKTSVRCR